MALTKSSLTRLLSEKLGIPQKEALLDLELLLAVIKETLVRGEEVKIARFGLFEVRNKHARRGRNPQTGEKITIEPRKIISFKPSQILRQALNR